MATPSMSAWAQSFINSPTGPKTTHFWGPVANWGFVIAVSLKRLLKLEACETSAREKKNYTMRSNNFWFNKCVLLHKYLIGSCRYEKSSRAN